MRLFLTLIVAHCFLFSCGNEDQSLSKADMANASASLELVDSLLVDYLGSLQLADMHEASGQFLFFDAKRTLFLVTDETGETLSEFTKMRDSPDFSEMIGYLPFFIDANKIGVLSIKKLFVYSLSGDLVDSIEFEEENPYRAMIERSANQPIVINGSQAPVLLFPLPGPPDPPSVDNPEFSDLSTFRAIQMVDLNRKTSEQLIGFEENSRFLQGKPHHMAAMSPLIHLDGDVLYVSFVQEPIVRKYKLKGNILERLDEFPLNPEIFHDQDPNPVDMNDVVERFTFKFDGMEAAKVKFIHAYGEEFFSVYNPGKKAEDMQRFTITRHESGGIVIGGSKIVNEDLEPKDHLQYFRNGVKVGNDLELPPYFDEVLLGKGPYLWFSRNTRKDEYEADYVTFYKVRVVAE